MKHTLPPAFGRQLQAGPTVSILRALIALFVIGVVALMIFGCSPASAKDWWMTTGRVGDPLSACDHVTRDEGVDPGQQMARSGSIIIRNAIQPPILWSNHSESPLGDLSIVRFKFREGPDVVFAYAETPEACDMVRSGKIPMPERNGT